MATAGNHRDFDVRIWSDEGRYFAQVVDSPVGRSAREPLKAPFGSDPRERELYRLQLENAVLRAQVASPDAVMAGVAGPQANGSPVEDPA